MVRKIESPDTHGDDGDQGTSICHKEFVGAIFIGGLALAATPEQFGPRNCGQFPVAAAEPLLLAPIKAAQIAAIKIRSFI